MVRPPDDANFACAHCGRQHAWNADTVGQDVRCPCGAVVQMPPMPDPFADDRGSYLIDKPSAPRQDRPAAGAGAATLPPPPTPDPFADDRGIYEVDDTPPPPKYPSSQQRPPAVLRPSPDPVVSLESLEVLEEIEPPDASTDRTRDYYAPAAILAVGTLAIIALVYVKMTRGIEAQRALSLNEMLAALAALISIKALILVSVAALLARLQPKRWRLFHPAALKFAAVVLFMVAFQFWLHVADPNDSTGRSSWSGRRGYAGVPSAARHVPIMSGVLLGLLYYLFCFRDESSDENDDQTRSHFLWLVVLLMLSVDIGSAIGLRRYMRPAPIAAPGAGAAPAPLNLPTPADAQISATIAAGAPMQLVREGRDWKASVPGQRDRRLAMMIDMLYVAGAPAVYVDLQGQSTGRPLRLYVELPADPRQRTFCFSAIEACFPGSTGQPAGTPPPPGKYLDMPIPLKH